MRKKRRQSSNEEALELLGNAREHHLSTTLSDGTPVLRVLNGVLVENWLLFHGALVGEKVQCFGQRAVVSSYEVVANIPSYFVDEHKACPATTLYRSAQATGVLVQVTEPRLKATMLQTLMEKLQKEGGHVPIDSGDPLYEKSLKSVTVFGFRIESLAGKKSLGQDRSAERTQKVVRGLWGRGAPGDLRAIEQILELSPQARPEEWSKAGEFTFIVHPEPHYVEEHALLLEGQYWREDSTRRQIERAISLSSAWVGVLDGEGYLLGAGRAVTDGEWVAQIVDVVVAARARGRGLGRGLMGLLLDHPLVKYCRHQKLGTMDAVRFYEALGFVEQEKVESPFEVTSLCRTGQQRPDARRGFVGD